ncbi:MAG: RIP metalloprotease RseP [Bacteroidales bacterium]|nr:RIP metalloprotease RseP [Bacteroidales bacterium]
MIVVLFKTIQVILALSILVIIHELGHFFWAKVFGIRVEKFYLFFDIGGKAIFKFKPKKSETEYGIGWLPLGGYCKISGMIDESFDRESLNHEPEEWEFRSRPAWQRFLVMFGGVLNNFILAIILYIVITFTWGSSYISNKDCEIYASPLATEMGFKTGDKVISLDDYEPEDFGTLQADIARRKVEKVSVLRGSDTVKVYIDESYIGNLLKTPAVFSPAVEFIIDSVAVKDNEVLQKGDKIISIAGVPTPYLQDGRIELAKHSYETIAAEVVRGADTITLNVKVDSIGHIGVFTKMPDIVRYKEYNFAQAIPQGVKTAFSTIGSYLQDLRLVATPSSGAYKSVGSFISIGSVFPSVWNWYSFLSILALLSIMLAVMNLLPIPVLDGGHILFLIIEMIIGHKVSDKTQIIAQYIGLILIMLLMFLAFGNDISMLINR